MLRAYKYTRKTVHCAAYLIVSAIALSACTDAPHDSHPETSSSLSGSLPAPRIVSLDFCADQYALELLPRAQILALSPDADADFSYHKARALGLPHVRPRAEDVLALNPDMIIRSYGGGPGAARLFETANIPVVNIGWASHLRGDEAGSVAAVIRDVAVKLNAADKGDAIIADYHRRLEALEQASKEARPSALYMTPYGVTTGPGSLVHDMIEAAGFENFQTRAGWRPLPLERLVSETPDHIITGFFDSHDAAAANWSSMRHPVAKRTLASSPNISLKGAWTSCGAWFLADAVEAMSAAHKPSHTPSQKPKQVDAP